MTSFCSKPYPVILFQLFPKKRQLCPLKMDGWAHGTNQMANHFCSGALVPKYSVFLRFFHPIVWWPLHWNTEILPSIVLDGWNDCRFFLASITSQVTLVCCGSIFCVYGEAWLEFLAPPMAGKLKRLESIPDYCMLNPGVRNQARMIEWWLLEFRDCLQSLFSFHPYFYCVDPSALLATSTRIAHGGSLIPVHIPTVFGEASHETLVASLSCCQLTSNNGGYNLEGLGCGMMPFPMKKGKSNRPFADSGFSLKVTCFRPNGKGCLS